MKFTILARAASLFLIAFKLLTDSSFPATVCELTGAKFTATQTECTLLGTILVLLATTDLIPLLESNLEYFRSIVRVRLIVSVVVHIVSSQSYVAVLSNDLVIYYAMLEEVFNACILMELAAET